MFTSKRPAPVGPGEESVWDYPRPPRLEPVSQRLRVEVGGRVIGETLTGWRVLETSHPPTYYFPPEDVDARSLVAAAGTSMCEWKGTARYWDIVTKEGRIARAAWSYPQPTPAFRDLRDHLCFYASKVDACWVGEEQVQPQAGDFYGGWITSKIKGPFKGAPGTWGW